MNPDRGLEELRRRAAKAGPRPGPRSPWGRRAGLVGLLASLSALTPTACAGPRPAVESPPPLRALAGEESGGWLGPYRALSDWELTIVLEPDGRALIRTTWWGASGSKLRQVPAHWSRRDGDLTLRYGEVVDRFALDRARPDDDRDGDGAERVRLTALEPIHPRSLVGLTQLWRDPRPPASPSP